MTSRPDQLTRQAFLTRLRTGLAGMPKPAADDIIADYNAHFAEAAAAGRNEADVAAKLGDPDRLARELRAEAGLRRWEQNRNPAAALGAVIAVLGLATVDLLILLPVLLVVGIIVFAVLIVAAVVCFVGSLFLLAALLNLLPGFDGTWLQGVLIGLGIATGGASTLAFCALFIIGTTNLLVRYGRLHTRAVSPITPGNPHSEYLA